MSLADPLQERAAGPLGKRAAGERAEFRVGHRVGPVANQRFLLGGGELGGDDREFRFERRGEERLVERPGRPSARLPLHRTPQGVGRRVRGPLDRPDRMLSLGVQHLEGDDGAQAPLRQPADDRSLQPMVRGVVVLLAEQPIARALKPGPELFRLDPRTTRGIVGGRESRGRRGEGCHRSGAPRATHRQQCERHERRPDARPMDGGG